MSSISKVGKTVLAALALTCMATAAQGQTQTQTQTQTFRQWMAGADGATHVGAQVKIERFTPGMAQQIKAAGLEFVRFGVWVNAMHGDAYRAEVARAFEAAREGGLPVILTVRDTAPLLSGNGNGAGTATRDERLRAAAGRLSATIAELAKSYHSEILAVELWNEPEFEKYWPTGNTDETFPVYMRAVCAGLNEVRASTPVIGFAFATRPAAGSRSDQLLREAGAPALRCLDAVSWHAYGMSAEKIAEASRYVRASYGLPTVITEWGVSSGRFGSEGSQAAAIATFLRERNDLRTPLISIYEWQNTANAQNSKERNFGLVDASGQQKPALNAVESVLKRRQAPGL
jgi:polysaccharide biosynthesis protein PslG